MAVNKNEKLWDERSSKYPRFNGELSEFAKEFFSNLIQFGVDFKDKSVIDIGCGTGVYTLYIAKICKEIFAIDASAKMLEILMQDAQNFKISNLKSQKTFWQDFKSEKFYDIAISTMSPALCENDDFYKFNSLAKTKIYLNFNSPRFSSLLMPFFKRYNISQSGGKSAKKLEIWLDENKIKYKKANFNEKRIAKRSKEEAMQNVCWHLSINDANFDPNDIQKAINELNFKQEINDEINSLMSLYVF
ncbi:MAG: class I SAM-dependent methyltransferase [Campylobacter sp.]|nr:class I SAM-dependent methyltransferase [Campylobacter sp.]